jgi:MFS family permease
MVTHRRVERRQPCLPGHGRSAFGWGWLSDRWGRARWCCPAWCCWASAWSRAATPQPARVPALFGVLVGVAGGSFYAPLMTVASAWFDRQRNLAVALISAGMGMAPLDVAPFVRWLISAYDWRTAMLVVASSPPSLLIRRRC